MRQHSPNYTYVSDWPDEPLPSELGMYLTLAPIAAEFSSDPTSVACFDLRLVERAKTVVRQFEFHFGTWMKNHPKEVGDMSERLLGLRDVIKPHRPWRPEA